MSKLKLIIITIITVIVLSAGAAVGIYWGDIFRHEHNFIDYVCECGEYADNVDLVVNGNISTTLKESITAAPTDGTETLITLHNDIDSEAIKTEAGQNIVLDLNGHTLSVKDPAVGSAGTQTLGFQFLKGSKVTIKNGTIEVKEGTVGIKMLVQNYCDLTLENVVLDGRNLDTNATYNYTLSNNCGNVVIKGTTKIYATENRTDNLAFAFDACRYATYTDGVTVTFVDFIGEINGAVEISGNAAGKIGEAKIVAPNGQTLTNNGIYYFV